MSEFLSVLNPVQRQAAEAVEGAVMVLAGAGSGKTRVLTNRIAHMVKDLGINPDDILAVTFTNKAANEMRSRLRGMLDNIGRMLITTIHSMCTRILRYESDSLTGYMSNFSIYAESDSEKVLKAIAKRLELNDSDAELPFKYHISNAKNAAMTPFEYYKEVLVGDSHGKVIYTVMNEYEKSLRANNAMDFDDLLYNTYKLFTTDEAVLEKYRQRFKYISIDEFQDTNRVQYKIIKMLAEKFGNIFIVGDDDQSIYGWRGADVRNLLDFKKDFPDVKIFKLEQNYRSTKKILDVANTIIAKNPERYDKRLWTENSDGVRIEMYNAPSEAEEATYVVNQIASLKRFNNLNYRDCAVLMRINALSRAFEQELMKYGIPCKIYGGFKFFDRKEVKDILAYLRLIDNPSDDEAFFRIINFPRRGIGESTLNKLRTYGYEEKKHALEAAVSSEEITGITLAARAKLKNFAQLILDMTETAENTPLLEFVDTLFDVLEIRKAYANENKGDFEKSLVVDEFRQAVGEYVKENPDAGLSDFLQSVTLQADYANEDEDEDSVTIATIHSAKGLEFKSVFVVGLEQNIFPGASAYFDLKQMSEERRLMYVATTRAMERLYLTRASSRFLYGQRKEQMESIFYKEVSQHLGYSLRSQRTEGGRDYTERYTYSNGYTTRSSGGRTYNADVGEDAYSTSGTPSATSYGEYKSRKAASGGNSSVNFPKGTKVNHKVFGDGVVIAQDGDNIRVVFYGLGVKTLAAKFAPIKKLED